MSTAKKPVMEVKAKAKPRMIPSGRVTIWRGGKWSEFQRQVGRGK